jgi:hypothetical protein
MASASQNIKKILPYLVVGDEHGILVVHRRWIDWTEKMIYYPKRQGAEVHTEEFQNTNVVTVL